MEIKKSYIIVIAVLLVYVVIVLYLNKDQIFNETRQYIIFSDSQILEIDKGKYTYLKDFSKIKNLKFKIYDYTEYKGEYTVEYIDEKYRVFDDSNNPIKFKNDFLAIYSNNDNATLNTSETESLNENDKNIIKRMLEKQKISVSTTDVQGYKRKINVKKMDNAYIYNVSYNNITSDGNDIFSILFVSDGTEDIIVEKSVVSSENYINLKSYYINAIIDTDADENDEIILSTLSYSQNGEQEKIILKYDKKGYKNIK
jgi:hypothetical protein